jgi:transposase-like protein
MVTSRRRSRLAPSIQRALLQHFVAGTPARSAALLVDRHNHINGIENFWSQAKRHLRRYNGIVLERPS